MNRVHKFVTSVLTLTALLAALVTLLGLIFPAATPSLTLMQMLTCVDLRFVFIATAAIGLIAYAITLASK